MANNLEQYSIENATHWLLCRHCIGRNCTDYEMKCIVLDDSNIHRQKIVVFGERNWAKKEHIKKIRYVSFTKLMKINTDEKKVNI